MDFWKVFDSESLRQDFGTKELALNTGPRHALSLKTVEDRSTELASGTCLFRTYSYDKRYVIVRDITRDLLIIIFDVNSSAVLSLRFNAEVLQKDARKIHAILSRIKRPNIEFRAIGLQNSTTEPLSSLHMLRKVFQNKLAEADLFGNSTRHIAIDTRTGMTYNLLLLNRIYRPGELLVQNNEQKPEEPAPVLPTALRFIPPEETHAEPNKQIKK